MLIQFKLHLQKPAIKLTAVNSDVSYRPKTGTDDSNPSLVWSLFASLHCFVIMKTLQPAHLPPNGPVAFLKDPFSKSVNRFHAQSAKDKFI